MIRLVQALDEVERPRVLLNLFYRRNFIKVDRYLTSWCCNAFFLFYLVNLLNIISTQLILFSDFLQSRYYVMGRSIGSRMLR